MAQYQLMAGLPQKRGKEYILVSYFFHPLSAYYRKATENILASPIPAPTILTGLKEGWLDQRPGRVR